MLLLVSFSQYSYANKFSIKYDKYFKSASMIYLPMWDYYWLKAQCYQESRLNPQAVSPVGAKGMCQFMPATWDEVSNKFGWNSASIINPELNIHAAAYYDGRLRKQWSSKRSESDRRNLVFASYNAGLGNILKAQKLCQMQVEWSNISPCLEEITGQYHKETLQYVENINKWYWMMKVN